MDLLKQLSAKSCEDLYVLIQDKSSEAMLPVLRLIALMISARNKILLSHDGQATKITWLDYLEDIFRIGSSALAAIPNTIMMMFLVEKLKRQDRKGFLPEKLHNDKVLYIKSNLWLGVQAGGAVTHTVNVVKSFVRRGLDVELFSSSLTDLNLPKLNTTLVHLKSAFIIPRELNHISFGLQFSKKILDSDVGKSGFIYQRLSILNCTGPVISRRFNLPLIIEYNGSEAWMARNWGTKLWLQGLVQAAEDVTLKHAHLIVTVSEALAEELRNSGVEPERIFVSPNGVDPAAYKTLIGEQKGSGGFSRTKLGIPADSIVYSFVGTFGAWHGTEVLADAAIKIFNEDPDSNFYFLFIGDGVRRNEVERRIKGTKAESRVIFLGLVSPHLIPELLALSDSTVLPIIENPDGSEFFGSPTKLFEYMASSRVIIASDIGQISEVLSGAVHVGALPEKDHAAPSDQCGVLMKPGSVDQLCSAIRFVANNPVWRKSAGLVAQERVFANYTWDQNVDRLLSKLTEDAEKKQQQILRLLINGLHSKSGGGVTYLNNVLPHLSANKQLDVHICIHADQYELFRNSLNGITYHQFNFTQGFWKRLLSEQYKVPKLAREIGADVTFSPANFGPFFSSNSVVLLRNSLAVANVEKRLPKLIYWGLLYIATYISTLRASRVIAVSNYASTLGAGEISFINNKKEIIPHGINLVFQPDSHAKRDENELLVVSDIYVQKNIHTLIKALPNILKRHPNVILRIAGNEIDHDYTARIKSIIADLGVSENVVFEGGVGVDKLLKLYQRCVVFVFPSTVETFGNPLVEAMACGATIACSNTAAMPEIAGDAVMYFDPNKAEDMEQVICKLLSDPDLRNEFGEKAINRSKKYSWHQTAIKTALIMRDAAIT